MRLVMVAVGVVAVGGAAVGAFLVVHDGARAPRDVDVSQAANFDGSLRTRVVAHRVNPADGAVPADQFLATAAYDRSTHDLWVCYYDTRPDPRRRSTRFTCTVSHDGGGEFEQPQPAASVRSDETGPNAAHFPFGHEYGDFEAVVAADGVAHPLWTDSRDLATRAEEIYTTTLRAR